MIETINLLKQISLYLVLFGIICFIFSLIVLWRYQLFEYYQFKRGKTSLRKVSSPVENKRVSHYYSEVLDDDSHEITVAEDDSSSLSEDLSQASLKDIYNDSTSYVQQEIVSDVEPGSEETTILNDGNEETTMLRLNDVLYETEIIEIPEDKEVKASNQLLDQTEVIDFNEDEGEDDNVNLTAAKENNIVTKKFAETDTTLYDMNGEDETTVLSSVSSNDQAASSQLWSNQIFKIIIDNEFNRVVHEAKL